MVDAARDVEVDDYVVQQALRRAIEGRPSPDAVVESVVDLLTAGREMRRDISDDLWGDAMRVVYASVRRHSSCEPGDYSYLDFVSPYIK